MAYFTISHGLKAFAHAIQCLAKCGKDIHFQLNENRLTLKAVNELKTVFLCLIFERDCGVFDEYDPRVENSSVLFCRVPSKALCSVFRSMKWTNLCRVSFSRKDDIEPTIIFEMSCNYDVKKTYRLYCEHVEVFQADFEKNGDSGFMASSSQLVSVFDNLKGDSTEVSIQIAEDKLTFQSYDEETSRKPILTHATSSLKSETIFQSQDLEQFAFPNTTSDSIGFIFSLKELKHFASYCDSSTSSSISCYYHYNQSSHAIHTLPLCFTASVPLSRIKLGVPFADCILAEIIVATLPFEIKVDRHGPTTAAADTTMENSNNDDDDEKEELMATATSTGGLIGKDTKNMLKRARLS